MAVDAAPSSTPSTFDRRMKFAVCGSPRSGKTQLCHAIIRRPFSLLHSSTLVADVYCRRTQMGALVAAVECWDFGGDPRSHALTRTYYSHVHVVALTYSVVDEASAAHLRELRVTATNTGRRRPPTIVLVGQKADFLADPLPDVACAPEDGLLSLDAFPGDAQPSDHEQGSRGGVSGGKERSGAAAIDDGMLRRLTRKPGHQRLSQSDLEVLPPAVSIAEELAREHGLPHFFTSAKTGAGVQEMFHQALAVRLEEDGVACGAGPLQGGGVRLPLDPRAALRRSVV